MGWRDKYRLFLLDYYDSEENCTRQVSLEEAKEKRNSEKAIEKKKQKSDSIW